MTTADPTCFECGKPATNYSCRFGPDTGLMDPALNACAEHKCRCRQPAMYMAPEPRPEEPTRQEPDVVTVAARHLLHAVDSGSDSTDERRVLAALVWPPGSLAQAPRSSQASTAATSVDMRGWTLDEYPASYLGATRRRRGGLDEVSVDVDGLDVRIEDGSGYMRQTADVSVPMAVLVALLRRAGYVIARSDAPRSAPVKKDGGA